MQTYPEFEEKIRKCLILKETISHKTTIRNAISALEKGLKTQETLIQEGIEYEPGGYMELNPSFFPDAISFNTQKYNFVFDKAVFLSKKPHLIVDDKYSPLLKEIPEHYHPVYYGNIPEEDVLSLVFEFYLEDNEKYIPQKKLEDSMEYQRKILTPNKITPVFYSIYSTPLDLRTHLYLPECIRLSPETQELLENNKVPVN